MPNKTTAVTCPVCNQERQVQVFHTKESNFTGRCSKCRGLKGASSPKWKGGKYLDNGGYVRVHAPMHPNAYSDGYVMEHRLVMELKLGRYLDRKETVHHKDGDRQNNNPDNLELWTGNHGNGVKVHDITRKAFNMMYYSALIPFLGLSE